MDGLTAFGRFAVAAMLLFYALQGLSRCWLTWSLVRLKSATSRLKALCFRAIDGCDGAYVALAAR
jgi:hypothetical protein